MCSTMAHASPLARLRGFENWFIVICVSLTNKKNRKTKSKDGHKDERKVVCNNSLFGVVSRRYALALQTSPTRSMVLILNALSQRIMIIYNCIKYLMVKYLWKKYNTLHSTYNLEDRRRRFPYWWPTKSSSNYVKFRITNKQTSLWSYILFYPLNFYEIYRKLHFSLATSFYSTPTTIQQLVHSTLTICNYKQQDNPFLNHYQTRNSRVAVRAVVGAGLSS